MRSRRRFLMLSSTWLQKRRKYWAAETSALITTSQSRICASGFSDGCRAATMSTATAHTCKTIFVFPSVDASIVNPSAEAIFRRPRTVNSLPMMITTIHGGTRCMSTSEKNAKGRHLQAPPSQVSIRPIGRRSQEQNQHAPDLEVHGEAPEVDVGTTGEEDHDEDGNEEDPQQRQ